MRCWKHTTIEKFSPTIFYQAKLQLPFFINSCVVGRTPPSSSFHRPYFTKPSCNYHSLRIHALLEAHHHREIFTDHILPSQVPITILYEFVRCWKHTTIEKFSPTIFYQATLRLPFFMNACVVGSTPPSRSFHRPYFTKPSCNYHSL